MRREGGPAASVPVTVLPFDVATQPRPLGDGTFTTSLRAEWAVGGHSHDGFLLGLLARTAMAGLADEVEGVGDPVSVSAQFLRPISLGPALLRTEVRKAGRRGAAVAVRLEQRGRGCVEAAVITGKLPHRGAVWSDLPVMSVEPPANAVPVGGIDSGHGHSRFPPASECDVRIDASMASLVSKPQLRVRAARDGAASPLLRLWVRPRHGDLDPYFALLAADLCPPMSLGVRHPGWAPAVQLTAFVRARPVPGWLRVQVESRSVDGLWFDADATVIDAAGHLVAQARKLAMTPGP